MQEIDWHTTFLMPLLVTSAQHPSHIQVAEEKARGRISMATYMYYHYFRAGGKYLVLAIVLLVFLMEEVGVYVCVCVDCRSRGD